MRRESWRATLAAIVFIASAAPITAAATPFEDPALARILTGPFDDGPVIELRIDTPDGTFYAATRDRQPVTLRGVDRDVFIAIQPVVEDRVAGSLTLRVFHLGRSIADPVVLRQAEAVPVRIGHMASLTTSPLTIEVEGVEWSGDSSAGDLWEQTGHDGDCCVSCGQWVMCGCRVKATCGSCCGDCCTY